MGILAPGKVCACAPVDPGAGDEHEPACPRYWDHVDGAASLVTACRYAQHVASFDRDRARRCGDLPGTGPAVLMAAGIVARVAELHLELGEP